ncbi:MAG: bacteriocin fulvocin C-related protein [Bacteroidetes bacterium]|nr:bacteriocin fulvocin C-related protein [Bacteroidota bacterium]
MKKYLSILSILLFILSSCQKSESHRYSCDEEINCFVVENLDKISDMNRKDLITYNIEYQRAMFRAMSPENRYSCWNDKLFETLKLEWSQDEFDHIIKLRNEMSVGWFNEEKLSNPNYKNIIDAYLRNWIETGINEIGFSEGIVYSIVVTLDLYSEDNKLVDYMKAVEEADRDIFGTCTCSTTSDWCDISGYGTSQKCKLHHDNCTYSSLGCGTLWTSPCDGKCALVEPGGD